MLRRIARDPRNLPFALAAMLALLLVPEIPSPAVRPTSGWRGWYVLTYREAAAPAVEASLRLADPGSVSRTSATVRINAFHGIEALPVADLVARLDPLDPRMDAWLAGVGGYFRVEAAATAEIAAYVPATRGRLAVGHLLSRAFRDGGVPRGSWRLVELAAFPVLSGPLAALCFAVAIAVWLPRDGRRGLPFAAAGVAVWLPGLVNGGLPDLCLCCLSLYLWLPRAIEGSRDTGGRRSSAPLGRTGVRIGVLLAAALAVFAADDAAAYRTARMGASVLSLELLAVIAGPILRLRSRKRAVRRGFTPVPIRSPRSPVFVPLAAALAAGLLAAAPPCLSRLRSPLPRPVSLARAGSRTGIEAAARAAGPEALPGLADAVSHAASLQTLAFESIIDGDTGTGGERAQLPPPEGRLRLREYADGNAPRSLVEAPRTVVRFDPGWLERIVAGFGDGTVERLLVGQARAVEIRRAPRAALLARSVPVALVCLALLGAPLAGPTARRRLIRLGLWAIPEPARRRRTR